jgi:hypothetical protein
MAISSSLALVLLAAIVGTGVIVFFRNAPNMDVEITSCQGMSVSFLIQGVLPTFLGGRNDKIGTVTALWQCARVYKEVHSYYVLLSFILVYVTLQTFAIPGPIILSILSGALYPFLEANVLVALCATCGASLCFCLSSLLGRSLVQRFFPKMIANFKDKVRVL